MGFLPSCCCVHTTIWMHHINTNKMHQNENFRRMQHTVLNKSWKLQPMKKQLYSHVTHLNNHFSKTNMWGHCWRSKDELISNLLLWTPTHGCASVGWPKICIHQLCMDTGCNLEDLPGAIEINTPSH